MNIAKVVTPYKRERELAYNERYFISTVFNGQTKYYGGSKHAQPYWVDNWKEAREYKKRSSVKHSVDCLKVRYPDNIFTREQWNIYANRLEDSFVL